MRRQVKNGHWYSANRTSRGIMTEVLKRNRERFGSLRTAGPALALGGLVLLAAVLGLTGCGGNNNSTSATTVPPGLPVAPVPTPTNTYIGTQSPGLWSYTLDDTQELFSYLAITNPPSPDVATTGSWLTLSGFQNLTNTVFQPAGYGLEIPSRAAFLRPGGNQTPLVAAVQQNTCFPLGGDVRFQFVLMPNATVGILSSIHLPAAYGSIVASTTPDGSSWQFGDQVLYGFPVGSELSGYPVSFSGMCTTANGQASISVSASASSAPYPVLPTTFAIGPTGFFLEDTSSNTIDTSMIGVVQPSSPLITANVVAGKYLGFMSTPSNLTSKGVVTQPIAFGQVISGTGTSMTGGVFPGDDLTQLPNTDTVITLGAQDPSNNGLYPSATITVPDPGSLCVGTSQGGFDMNGNPTCTSPAVAVVGNPENKFAIFLITTTNYTGITGIYLYQQ